MLAHNDIVLQSKLPTGAEVVGLHLGSDKLAITNHPGDHKMHPLLLTLAGLSATMHLKLSNNVWMCIAYLPVPKFTIHASYQSILANCVMHKAMDLITENLKIATCVGHQMADAWGNICLFFPLVVAISGDLVEHLSMAALSSSILPVCLVTSSQFGDGIVHAQHTKAHTLNLIHTVSKAVDP